MRNMLFVMRVVFILLFFLFTQSNFTYGQDQTSTLSTENNTNAKITIYLEKYGVIYDGHTKEIPPMKTTSLKNLLPMGRNVIIAAARNAPMKKHQDEFGNIIQEYYTAKEVFWVSEEGTKIQKYINGF
jgi:hypothetical protein